MAALANVNVGAGGDAGGGGEHNGRFVLAVFLIWIGAVMIFFAVEGLALADPKAPATGGKNAWTGLLNALRTKAGTAPAGQAGDGGGAPVDSATPVVDSETQVG